MRKTRILMLGMLLAMSVFALSACSSRGNNNNTATGENRPTTTQTTQEMTTGGTMETTPHADTGANETRVDESSTGVIGGMIDDMEQGVKNGVHNIERGVNDVMDGTTRAAGKKRPVRENTNDRGEVINLSSFFLFVKI